MEAIERKYALIKIETGDYLLPSNDATTLWRLRASVEGPSSGLRDWPKDRKVWEAFTWDRPLDAGLTPDPFNWDEWTYWGGMYDSRNEAIDEVLRAAGSASSG